MFNYQIETQKWGYKIIFNGRVCVHDLKPWFQNIIDNFVDPPKHFGVLFDFRKSDTICAEASQALVIARGFLIGKGMNRSVIIYDSSVKIVELMRALKIIGYYKNQRYICSVANDKWERAAMDWLTKGIEP